jgi:hypothetical protein
MSIPFKKDPDEFNQRSLFATNVFDLLQSDHACFVYEEIFKYIDTSSVDDDKIPCILEPELSTWAFRRNWARLIQKIYEVDPLLCPKCSGAMRVIAFIEAPGVIRKILKHLNLWDIKRKPQPLANAPPIDILPLYDDPPGPSADDLIIDPQYPDSLSGVV